MRVMPHVKIFVVKDIDLQIDLAMSARAYAGRRHRHVRGQRWRKINRSLCAARVDQPMRKLATANRKCSALTDMAAGMLRAEHAVEGARWGQLAQLGRTFCPNHSVPQSRVVRRLCKIW